jgi:CheY-like chemotaxis protein
LLTDVVMPGMKGRTATSAYPEARPQVLFIGYADDVGIGATDQLSDYLQKPFTPEALSQRIRHLLDLAPLPQNGSPRKEASTSHAS